MEVQNIVVAMGVLALMASSMDMPTTPQLNEQPIIGILTQPSKWDPYPGNRYSYIATSYVKFIEQSGARVMPIPYDTDNATLGTIFQSINGIVFPGGSTIITGPSKYMQSAAYLFNLAIAANDEGDFFPIMGICLGHEMIAYILNGYANTTLIRVEGVRGVLLPLHGAKRDCLFYATMSDTLFAELTRNNISYYHHYWAVSPNLFAAHPHLNDFLQITATNQDLNGTVFVASTQGRKYPVYTTQYHSEKSAYEWEVGSNHSQPAIAITTVHSNQFVGLARKNHHAFTMSNKSLIYNYPTVRIKASKFMSVYLFDNGIVEVIDS